MDDGLARHTRYGYRLTPYTSQGDGPAQTVETETGFQPVTYDPNALETVTIAYTYDALNRLASASYDDGTAFGYTYDAAGNTLQLSKIIAGQTNTYITLYAYRSSRIRLIAMIAKRLLLSS